MKIMIAGGTGFIGGELVSQLKSKGHELFILTRNERRSDNPKTHYLKWDGKSPGVWAGSMSAVDAVINLAGESIAGKRWSFAQKEKIIQSRILATRALIEAVTKSNPRPKTFISASAVGYYGNVPEANVTESYPKGAGFLAETCDGWEKEAGRAQALGLRTVYLRLGVVLEKGGGALSKILPPFQFFLGGSARVRQAVVSVDPPGRRD